MIFKNRLPTILHPQKATGGALSQTPPALVLWWVKRFGVSTQPINLSVRADIRAAGALGRAASALGIAGAGRIAVERAAIGGLIGVRLRELAGLAGI